MGFFPGINTTIQHLVNDHMRGRVMSMYTMTFLGTMPIGSLAIGWLSDRLSAPHAVFVAGILTLLTAWFAHTRGFKLVSVSQEKIL